MSFASGNLRRNEHLKGSGLLKENFSLCGKMTQVMNPHMNSPLLVYRSQTSPSFVRLYTARTRATAIQSVDSANTRPAHILHWHMSDGIQLVLEIIHQPSTESPHQIRNIFAKYAILEKALRNEAIRVLEGVWIPGHCPEAFISTVVSWRVWNLGDVPQVHHYHSVC